MQILKFKEDLNHKHVNQLKKNPTKHVNMVYINCKQDHIDNEIKHIHKSHAMNNIHISIKKEKNKHENEIKYLLA